MFTFSDSEVEEHEPSTSGTKYSAPSTSNVNFEDSDDSVPIFWSERTTRILLTEVEQREEATNKENIRRKSCGWRCFEKKWVFIYLGTGERKMGYFNCSIEEDK